VSKKNVSWRTALSILAAKLAPKFLLEAIVNRQIVKVMILHPKAETGGVGDRIELRIAWEALASKLRYLREIGRLPKYLADFDLDQRFTLITHLRARVVFEHALDSYGMRSIRHLFLPNMVVQETHLRDRNRRALWLVSAESADIGGSCTLLALYNQYSISSIVLVCNRNDLESPQKDF
jgi:hypothetical protein